MDVDRLLSRGPSRKTERRGARALQPRRCFARYQAELLTGLASPDGLRSRSHVVEARLSILDSIRLGFRRFKPQRRNSATMFSRLLTRSHEEKPWPTHRKNRWLRGAHNIALAVD
jgi:hypothetical protein